MIGHVHAQRFVIRRAPRVATVPPPDVPQRRDPQAGCHVPGYECDTAWMESTILVCTDGSEPAEQAAAAGLAILQATDRLEVVTVAETPDATSFYDGGGHAGPTMTAEELIARRELDLRRANDAAQQTTRALGLDASSARVI